LPVVAGGHSRVEPGLATFEGVVIDLRDGWRQAEACVAWDSDTFVECFRSESGLLERIAAADESSLLSDGLPAAASSWRLVCLTGMRRSEVLGVRWRDVHLKEGRLAIVDTLLQVKGKPVLRTGEPRTEVPGVSSPSTPEPSPP
jgi:hypothetical protein